MSGLKPVTMANLADSSNNQQERKLAAAAAASNIFSLGQVGVGGGAIADRLQHAAAHTQVPRASWPDLYKPLEICDSARA
jgi:glycerol dehydrogenase-like iron-containing ADH family enzyme